MNGLMLHCGADVVDYDTLRAVEVPEATPTFTPIAHHQLLDAVRNQITASGLVINNQKLALSNAKNENLGSRFFGLLEIAGEESEYALTIGVRNSHSKIFPAGICVGSHCFVCDNMAFSAEIVIARRHTRWIGRDLPSLINRAVGQLGDLRNSQARRIEAYQNTDIDDVRFHDLAIRSVDAGVICASKLPQVLSEYRQPRHAEFAPRNVWSAFNAYTEILKAYDLQDLPKRTQILHGQCDLLCGMTPLQTGSNN